MAQTVEDLLQTGMQLLRARRIEEASRLADQLVQRFPEHRYVRFFAADAADARGDRTAALAQLAALPASEQGYAQLLLRKAQLLFAERRRAEALAAARTAAGCVARDAWQLRTLARILSDCLDPEGARLWLERAHGAFPTHVPILFDLVVVEHQLNRVDAAEQHLVELLKREPLHPGALHLRSVLRTQTPERNHVDDLEARLARAQGQVNVVAAASYALAKEYEDIGQYGRAFAALVRGARAQRSALRYDSASELAALDAIRQRFTREATAQLRPGCDAEGAIFVVGMPRTGTTLVERMLSSHGQVASIGEFPDFPVLLAELTGDEQRRSPFPLAQVDASMRIDFAELGRRYVAAARELAGTGRCFVDKLPFNFLYCGYIAAALPNARIVHLTRDPLDTIYAIYKTLFFNAYSFSYDLDELADYYVAYRRHMAHWHEVLPGRILDVSYEALVQDPDTHARRIVAWCGLPWEDAVLEYHRQDRVAMTASAAQVRRAPYTDSIGAWRRAEAGLAGVREKLDRAGVLTWPDSARS